MCEGRGSNLDAPGYWGPVNPRLHRIKPMVSEPGGAKKRRRQATTPPFHAGQGPTAEATGQRRSEKSRRPPHPSKKYDGGTHRSAPRTSVFDAQIRCRLADSFSRPEFGVRKGIRASKTGNRVADGLAPRKRGTVSRTDLRLENGKRGRGRSPTRRVAPRCCFAAPSRARRCGRW